MGAAAQPRRAIHSACHACQQLNHSLNHSLYQIICDYWCLAMRKILHRQVVLRSAGHACVAPAKPVVQPQTLPRGTVTRRNVKVFYYMSEAVLDAKHSYQYSEARPAAGQSRRTTH